MPAASDAGAAAVEVRPATPSLKIHSFSDSFLNHRLHFQVVGLKDSFFLWVGTAAEPIFANFSCAIHSRFDSQPSVASLFGATDDVRANGLARKLCAKAKKPVYVSLNIPPDQILLPLVEKRIVAEMKDNENCFGF